MTTLATLPGGRIPREKSWSRTIKEGVLMGGGIGLAAAVIFVSVGTWGNYPERMLVKTEARVLFSPDHVFEAKVLHRGTHDPAWVCWGPGHPVHACRAFVPDPDMPPACIEPTASFPASSRATIREIYGGTDRWGPPHPCRGLRIAKKVLPGEGVDFPPHHITEWDMPK